MSARDLLTTDEREALRLTKELCNVVVLRVMKPGTEFEADHRMFVTQIHAIQHMIMAQAAARAYPADYRLLGQGWGDSA
jgi:hypothetical protein